MDRPYELDTVATAPAMPPNLPNGYPSDGDPDAGRLATEPGAWWFHSVNEEIRNVITGAGLTPANAELNQLFLAIQAMIQASHQTSIDMAHPVGSLYLTTVAGNPADLFGGVWERYAQGRMLISAQDSGTYTVGKTGGAETVKLAVGNLPSHSHSASSASAGGHTHARGTMDITGTIQTPDDVTPSGAFYRIGYEGNEDGGKGSQQKVGFKASRSWSGATSSAGSHSHTISIGNTGSGTAFSILSPWQAVYVWRRKS